jgi:hypothetical protein
MLNIFQMVMLHRLRFTTRHHLVRVKMLNKQQTFPQKSRLPLRCLRRPGAKLLPQNLPKREKRLQHSVTEWRQCLAYIIQDG